MVEGLTRLKEDRGGRQKDSQSVFGLREQMNDPVSPISVLAV